MATDLNQSVKTLLDKGVSYNFSYFRSKRAPLDISMTWPSMNEMITYAMNDNAGCDYLPYEGQIVAVGKRAFILSYLGNSKSSNNYKNLWVNDAGTVDANHIITFTTTHQHFLPVELVVDNDGKIKLLSDSLSIVSDKLYLTVEQLNTNTISAKGTIETKGDVKAANLTATNKVEANNVSTTSINVSQKAVVGSASNTTTIEGDTIKTGTITTNTIGGGGNTWNISTVDGSTTFSINGSIEANKLVAKILEYKKTTYVGGRQITTVGGGAVIESVDDDASQGYKCYLNLNSDSGALRSNPFMVGDFALFQSFESNASRGYWRKVIAVGGNYVILSSVDSDKALCNPALTDEPQAGDTIVQVGYSGSDADNADRRYAIVISATSSNELVGVEPPYLAFYKDISSPAWTTPETLFSRNKNYITGEFKSTAITNYGGDLSTAINDLLTKTDNFGADLNEVSRQTDMSYSIWFAENPPTDNDTTGKPNTRYPNNQFTGDLSEHVQDICYVVSDNENGSKAYRYISDGAGGYKWQIISDEHIIKALENAYQAQNTANTAKTTAEGAQSTANEASGKADEAQSTANTAKTAADAAKTAADNAKAEADKAKKTLDDMAGDAVITSQEKVELRNVYAMVTSNYNKIVADAAIYGLDEKNEDGELTDETYGAYVTAYTNLNAMMAVVLADGNDYTFSTDEDDKDDVYTRKEWDDIWAAYYGAEESVYAYVSGIISDDIDSIDEGLGKLETTVATQGSLIESNQQHIALAAGWFYNDTTDEQGNKTLAWDKFIKGSALELTDKFATMFNTAAAEGKFAASGIISESTVTTMFAKIFDEKGDINAANITAAINATTGDSTVTLDADHINLIGYTCGYKRGEEDVETWSISQEGQLVVQSAIIAGWNITENAIISNKPTGNPGASSSTQTNNYVCFNSSGTIYCYSEIGNEQFEENGDHYASSKWGLKYDGSGRLATGNITWTPTGDVEIKGNIEGEGTLTIKENSTIAGWNVSSSSISKGSVSLGDDGSISSSYTIKETIDGEQQDVAHYHWLLGNNGDGKLANGNIEWDANGNGKMAGGKITWNGSGFTIGGAIIGESQITLSSKVDSTTNRVVLDANTNKIFAASKTGNITSYPWELNGNGNFFLANKKVEWNGTQLTVKGDIYADKYYMKKGDGYVEIKTLQLTPDDNEGYTNTEGDLTINNLTANNGRFSGELVAATGNFSGNLNAATGTFGGFIFRKKLIIDKDNIEDYGQYDDSLNQYEIELEKTGSWIEFGNLDRGDFSILFKGVDGSTNQQDHDDVLKYLGTKLVIYNKSSNQVTITGQVRRKGNSSNTSVGLGDGYCVMLECVLDFEEQDPTETVYWEYSIGKIRT